MWRIVAVSLTALLLAGCQVVVVPVPVPVAGGEPPAAVAEDASPPAPEPLAESATAVAGAINDADVLTQLANMRTACGGGKTSAQQQAALDEILPFFDGREVQLTGTVDDVRDLMDEFDVIVSLDGVDRDVMVDKLPEDLALSLNKGDSVLLAGELEIGHCMMYPQLIGTVTKRK